MISVESENFGLEVKKKLLDIGMQQSELAKEIGISKGYLSEILNDKKEGFDVRRKILTVINMKIEKGRVSHGN